MKQAETLENVRIADFPKTLIAELVHVGVPVTLPGTIRRFIDWRREHGKPPARSATFNVLYNDPGNCAPDDFRFGIGCEVSGHVSENSVGVETKTIPAGRCAVIPHKGSLDYAGDKIQALYRYWVRENNEELRDFPLFVKRLTFSPDVPEHEAELEIYLPIA